mmetsp:Transcript_8677/g.19627  ORF Transcript_8677/g.19627 Transcript_8677/m.19627 type:complete len:236 (-) Transcript_8677:212-919(-)
MLLSPAAFFWISSSRVVGASSLLLLLLDLPLPLLVSWPLPSSSASSSSSSAPSMVLTLSNELICMVVGNAYPKASNRSSNHLAVPRPLHDRRFIRRLSASLFRPPVGRYAPVDTRSARASRYWVAREKFWVDTAERRRVWSSLSPILEISSSLGCCLVSLLAVLSVSVSSSEEEDKRTMLTVRGDGRQRRDVNDSSSWQKFGPAKGRLLLSGNGRILLAVFRGDDGVGTTIHAEH